MSKMSKIELKSLIKECVKECLVEMIQGSTHKVQTQTSGRKATRKPARQRQKQNQSSQITVESRQNSQEAEKRNDYARQIASSATGDSILQEMLIDTANTTLPEQLNAERMGHAGRQSMLAQNSRSTAAIEPSLTEKNLARWSAIAFSQKK